MESAMTSPRHPDNERGSSDSHSVAPDATGTPSPLTSVGRRAALPEKEHLRNLSRWARVAYAYRCARRILLLWKFYGENTGQATGKQPCHSLELVESGKRLRDVLNRVEIAITSAKSSPEESRG